MTVISNTNLCLFAKTWNEDTIRLQTILPVQGVQMAPRHWTQNNLSVKHLTPINLVNDLSQVVADLEEKG